MRSPWAIDNDPRIGEANAQLILGPIADPARPGRTPRAGTQREKVLDALKESGSLGVTDYELWYRFKIGARPHVPGTRREELIADGWNIVDSGRRRPTDTGSPAIVWVLNAD